MKGVRVDLNDLYTQVSKELGLPKSKVEMVFRSMFEMVAETMRARNGENILIPGMGKFVVPLNKLRFCNAEKYTEEFSRHCRRVEKHGYQRPSPKRIILKQTDNMQGMPPES